MLGASAYQNDSRWNSAIMLRFPLLPPFNPLPNYRLFFPIEAANDKEIKSNNLRVTPRKTSQVNKEELAGKETLSKQYLKEDGKKKVHHSHKDTSTGNQGTSRGSTIATGRSGIPGMFMLPFSLVTLKCNENTYNCVKLCRDKRSDFKYCIFLAFELPLSFNYGTVYKFQ